MTHTIGDPTIDEQHNVSHSRRRATSTATPAIALSVQSPRIEHESNNARITTTPPKNPGKRKRSRSHLTTARESTEERHELTVKRARSMTTSVQMRPSLVDNLTNSDEEEDAVRFSVPPPPPTTPVPPDLVCRYPNKPCPQPRATKKQGDLHSYCAYHRFKAQQYQRKLEMKKRERRKTRSPSDTQGTSVIGQEMQGLALDSSGTTANPPSPRRKSSSPTVHRQGIRARTRSSPPRPSTTMYPSHPNPTGASQHPPSLEPFHHPVTLHEGDLQLLQVFLMDTESPPKPEATEQLAWEQRGDPRHAAQAASHQRGSGAYAVDLDGFTFTSESL